MPNIDLTLDSSSSLNKKLEIDLHLVLNLQNVKFYAWIRTYIEALLCDKHRTYIVDKLYAYFKIYTRAKLYALFLIYTEDFFKPSLEPTRKPCSSPSLELTLDLSFTRC
jgi:hypothetical protein